MKGYQLPDVHKKTLHPITPTNPLEQLSNATAKQRGSGHNNLIDAEKQNSLMFCVMPAHVAGVAAHAVSYRLLPPQGVDAVYAKLGVAVYADAISEPHKNDIGTFFERVMDDNKRQLERLYNGFYKPQGLASANYEG